MTDCKGVSSAQQVPVDDAGRAPKRGRNPSTELAGEHDPECGKDLPTENIPKRIKNPSTELAGARAPERGINPSTGLAAAPAPEPDFYSTAERNRRVAIWMNGLFYWQSRH